MDRSSEMLYAFVNWDTFLDGSLTTNRADDICDDIVICECRALKINYCDKKHINRQTAIFDNVKNRHWYYSLAAQMYTWCRWDKKFMNSSCGKFKFINNWDNFTHFYLTDLPHWGLVTFLCFGELGHFVQDPAHSPSEAEWRIYTVKSLI